MGGPCSRLVAGWMSALSLAAGAAARCPWDCGDGDAAVGVPDLLALLAQWGAAGAPCDRDGDGVNVLDFLDLLAHWGPCPPPVNDECATAIVINTGTYAFDSTGATMNPQDPRFSCGEAGADVWFHFVPPGDGVAMISTQGSSFGTVMETWTGCLPGPVDIPACSPLPQWDVLVTVTATGLWLRVGGAGSAQGPGVLHVDWVADLHGCPSLGSCCSSNGTPGCEEADCCELVCDLDPFCCDVTWDAICADEARRFLQCGCALPAP